jgi:hypothetical protein
MKQSFRVALLLLCLSVFALPVVAQTSGEMDFGDTFESNLTTTDTSREYTFQGEEGQVVSITLISDDFDPLLVLQDADGNEVAMDDDSGPGSLNSRIGPFTLPATGEYTIIAQSYSTYFGNTNPDAIGSFTLSLDEIIIRRIEYTQVAESELSTGNSFFQFRGEAGDIINVVVTSEDFSPAVSLSSLSSVSSYVLTSGADYSGEGRAVISSYLLQETGNYMLEVSSNDGSTGDFTIEVNQLDVTPIALGETVEVGFNENITSALFSFEAEAGDVIDLTVEGDGSFDTTLSLTGPDGYQLAYSDDSNGLDPAISNQILDIGGTYTVFVQPYRSGEKGMVTLTLARGVLLSLDEGPQVITFTSNQTRQTLVATGAAGEVVRLIVEVVGDGTTSPNITVLQSGTNVSYASSSQVHRIALDFTIPGDGQLLIQLEDYSFSGSQIEVSLERLSGGTTAPVSATPTPTPAQLPTEEATATEDVDGMIEPTEEAIIDAPTAEVTEAAETPAAEVTEEAAETPEAAETEVTEPEATEAA